MKEEQNTIVGRIVLNAALLVPYFVVLSSGESASPVWGIPMLAWGFFAFRQLSKHLTFGFMHVPVSAIAYISVVLIGSVVCAPFGILVIPVWIIKDLVQLRKSEAA